VCDVLKSRCVPCSATDQGACRGEKSVCEPVSSMCVECSAARQDTCPSDKRVCDIEKNTCVECSSAQPSSCDATGKHCLVADQRCVQCLEPTQCTDPQQSSCDLNQHTCRPCANEQACAHIAGMLACDMNEHRCVECTKATETQRCPPGTTCDESMHHCQVPPTATRQLCEACTEASQCGSAAVCQPYAGLGRFCFPKAQDGNCNMPQYGTLMQMPSDNGSIGFCEPAASCKAVQDANGRIPCTHNSGEQDDACGDRSLRDGVCNGNRSCSYLCLMPHDCAAGFSCRNGVCQ
jgi:hypothetical protein